VGKQGSRNRKATRHLPKVQGNPGKLWSDEPTPWVAGGETFLQWVGRAGPRAQASYFKRHRGSLTAFRAIGLMIAAGAVVTALAVFLR
jgi:hypothetical protein